MVSVSALLPHGLWLLASTYGSSSYGSSIYNGAASVQIGPVTLPVTGAGLLTIFGALAIATGVGLFIWARQRRKRSAD